MGTPVPPRPPEGERHEATPAERAMRHANPISADLMQGFRDVSAKRAAAQERLDAEGRAKAKRMMERAPRCEVCRNPIATWSGTRHNSCVPNTLAGTICICPNERNGRKHCTDTIWGDGGYCDPECVPCRLMRGQPYTKRSR